MLQSLIEIAVEGRKKEQKSHEAKEASSKMQVATRPYLSVSDVDYTSYERVELSHVGLTRLQMLTVIGVRLGHLLPLSAECIHDNGGMTTQALRDIACIDGTDQSREIGVGNIQVSDRYVQGPMTALASAAQHSPTAHTVEIDVGNGRDVRLDDQSHVWRWIAYSLFCRHADHTIQTLKMCLDRFQDVELEAIREMLEASDSVPILGRQNGARDGEDSPRQLVASQSLLRDDSGTPSRSFKARHDVAVRVLDSPGASEIEPWWSVILPGHGEAFVHKDDVISTSNADVVHKNREGGTVPAFPRIHVVVADETSDAVADLIGLIDEKTKRIDADDSFGSFVADECAERVLTACPELEELRVPGGSFEHYNIFISAAESARARLRVLDAGSIEAGDGAKEVRGFFGALSDPSKQLTKHLEELKMDVVVDKANATELSELVLRMLHQNRRLVRFHLGMTPDAIGCEDLRRLFNVAFAEMQSKPVCIRTSPLGIHEKLAFLSVVDKKAQSALGRMDAGVLAIVLQFVAKGQVREFSFSLDRA